MGGGMQQVDNCDFPSRTLVLIGRTGNGKSATGNSILQRAAFTSRSSFSGVNTTAEVQTALFRNGQVLKIIDTPGLFDFHVGQEAIAREIAESVELASNGIHAVLLVFSLTARFSEEEAAAIQNLQAFFGSKITDYIVVVFTGGDSLDRDESLTDRLAHGPEPLKEAAELQKKKKETIASKGHTEQELAEMQKSYDKQLEKMIEMVESQLKETNLVLKKQLEDEKAARKKAQKQATEDRERQEALNKQLRHDLAKAEGIARDAHNRINSCAIM